jgi:hypothetical protein
MDLDIIYQSMGKTRTGKIILYTIHREETVRVIKFFEACSFSIDDFLDAFAVFEYLAIRSIRRSELDAIFDIYADDIFTFDELQVAKERANIVSVFDLFDLGRSLVNVEFLDL